MPDCISVKLGQVELENVVLEERDGTSFRVFLYPPQPALIVERVIFRSKFDQQTVAEFGLVFPEFGPD